MTDRLCKTCEDEKNAWCIDCAESLCFPCATIHKRLSIPHEVLLTEDSTELWNFPKICGVHNKELSHFCVQHDALLCNFCKLVSHRNCKQILTTEVAARNVKSETAILDIKDRLGAIINMAEHVEKTCSNLSSGLENQQQKVRNKIKETRTILNAYLDKLEDAVETEMTCKTQEMTGRIEKHRKEIKRREIIFKRWQKEVSTFCTQVSGVNGFLGLKHIDGKISKEEKFIEDIEGKFYIRDIDFIPSFTKETLKGVLPSLGKLIDGEKQKITLPSEIILRSQVSIPRNSKNTVEDIPNVKRPTYAFKATQFRNNTTIKRGCFISENRLILSDSENQALFICRKDGKSAKRIELKFCPQDVTLLDQERVLVTGDSCMLIIDIPSFSIKKSIPLKFKPTFVCPVNEGVWVKEDHNHIKVLKMNGDVKKTITTENHIWDFCYSENSGTLYWSIIGWTDFPAYSINTEEERELFKSSEPFSAWGITVDRHENVYIAGNDSHTIQRISQNGEVDVVLTIDDGIYQPECIKYNQEADELLVINRNGTDVRIYNMK